VVRRAINLVAALARADHKRRWLADKLAWRKFWARQPREHLINQAFDRRHGTDTAEEIPLAQTGVPSHDTARGNGVYRPLWEAEFHAALAALKIRLDGCTFLDIGSGKGKLLMLAAEYPFRRIIGVEYSPGLDAVAQDNLARFRSPTQKCKALAAILGDALHYRLPPGPVVCFIFNSFDPETMRQVMHNLEADAGARDSPVYILYANVRRVAEIGDGFAEVKKLRRVRATQRLVIFANAAAFSGRTAAAAPAARLRPAPSR
jgi:SAM-dependent methyltransferase